MSKKIDWITKSMKSVKLCTFQSKYTLTVLLLEKKYCVTTLLTNIIHIVKYFHEFPLKFVPKDND